MSRSKINQTNAGKGIPFEQINNTEIAALPNDSMFVDEDGNVCIKKGGAKVPFLDANGDVAVVSGVKAIDPSNVEIPYTAKKLKFYGGGVSVESTLGEEIVNINIPGASSTPGAPPSGGAGAGGGDLKGLYPNPEIKPIADYGIYANPASPPLAPYQLPQLHVDEKGRVLSIQSLGAVENATRGQVLRHNGTAFVNTVAPYEEATYQGMRVSQGFNDVIYNTFVTDPTLASHVMAGSPLPTWNNTNENVSIGLTSTITSPVMTVGGYVKIIVDATPNTSYTVSWTTNSWSTSANYAPGSILEVPGGASTTFQIRITGGSSPGHINGYGVLHSTALPSNNTGSGVVIDASTYTTGNLAVTDNTVQKLADKVNTLAVGGGYTFETVIDGAWSGKALQKGKEYILLETDLPSAGSTSTTATLPALSGLAIGEGLIVNALGLVRGSNWSAGDSVLVQRSGSDTITKRSLQPQQPVSSGTESNMTASSANTAVSVAYYYNAGGTNTANFRRTQFIKYSASIWMAIDLTFYESFS